MNCDLGLQTDVWKNENLSGDFPSEAFCLNVIICKFFYIYGT